LNLLVDWLFFYHNFKVWLTKGVRPNDQESTWWIGQKMEDLCGVGYDDEKSNYH